MKETGKESILQHLWGRPNIWRPERVTTAKHQFRQLCVKTSDKSWGKWFHLPRAITIKRYAGYHNYNYPCISIYLIALLMGNPEPRLKACRGHLHLVLFLQTSWRTATKPFEMLLQNLVQLPGCLPGPSHMMLLFWLLSTRITLSDPVN